MPTNNLCQKLATHQEKQLIRTRNSITSRTHNLIELHGKQLINFSHNDYLSIAQHPQVTAAFIAGASQFGLGSGSSPVLAGYYQPTQFLEEKFAQFIQADRAILFNSGYHANLGVISTLANRQSLILADKFCHASILDGIQLSRAKLLRFRHNDLNHLELLLSQARQPCFIITESIFGMEGDISPIHQIAALAKNYNATLIVDDAHGIGVLGQKGRGIREWFNLTQADIPCLITPLGKAFASSGALVSGSHEIIHAISQFARTYLFSTALPPAIASATLVSLDLVEQETWRREKLQELIEYFMTQAESRGLPIISKQLTPIKSVIIGDASATLQIQQNLLERGFYVSCIRPPTVPEGTSRIKISLNCQHTPEEISNLLDQLGYLYAKYR
jgi:8-amino-7-oxononanoate synthase